MACQGPFILPSDALQTDMMYPKIAGIDEVDCPDHLAMMCQCDMSEDIKLKGSLHTHSLRRTVNIIIAVERLKHVKEMSCGMFCEEKMSAGKICKDALLNFILENVIEERLVKATNVAPIYSKDSRFMVQCTICDKYKNTLVKSNVVADEDLHLKAVTLSAGNSQYKVRFNMSMYNANRLENKGQPVCLGISNSSFYIACTKSDGSSPALLLKEVSGPLDTIKVGDPNGYDSLLFYRKETGTAYSSFESVKYPGWFITTAFDDKSQRVEMYQVPTDRTTDFTLEDQQKLPVKNQM